MAQSRLERIGTIYSRTTSLLRGGAMRHEDKPLWYVIYEAFPPKVEPRFDRPAPKIPIRQIFYEEDVIRAKFQRENKRILSLNLASSRSQSRTWQFINTYREVEKSEIPKEDLYSKAMEKYQTLVATSSKSDATEKNESTMGMKKSNIDLKKVFQD